MFEQAVTWDLIDRNPAARVKNHRAKMARTEFVPFESWEQVEATANELDSRYRAIPLALVGTGLRPEELFALERRDYDREGATLTVERVYSQGVLKDCGKSSRQRRRVPLRQRVVDAIEEMPPRIDSKLLFPAPRGGPIDLEKFRHREWTPALRAAGIEHRRVYDCRHTFASWSIAAGVPLFYLSRVMGCSITMLEQHYAHLLGDSEDYLRGLLDTYDRAAMAQASGGSMPGGRPWMT